MATGELRWSSDDDRRVLAVIDKNVYLLDKDNRCVRAVNQSNGQPAFGGSLCEMLDLNIFIDNTTTGSIYSASDDGRVICIKPISTKPLTQDMVKAGKSP